MQNGIVSVWSPDALLSGKSEPLATLNRNKGPVKAMQFNPHASASQLLATGSSDREVYMVDMGRPDQPNVYSPGAPGTPKHSASGLCSVEHSSCASPCVCVL